MVKKVNRETVSLWDILSATCTYSIPYNQRPHTWNLKNSDPLKSPSEIDKRTIEISNCLKILFIDKMKY